MPLHFTGIILVEFFPIRLKAKISSRIAIRRIEIRVRIAQLGCNILFKIYYKYVGYISVYNILIDILEI